MEVIGIKINITFKAFNYSFPIEVKTNEDILQSIQHVSKQFNIEPNNLQLVYQEIVLTPNNIGTIIFDENDEIQIRFIKEVLSLTLHYKTNKEIIQVSVVDSVGNIKQMLKQKYGDIVIYREEKGNREILSNNIIMYTINLLNVIFGKTKFILSCKRVIDVEIYNHKYPYECDDEMKIGEIKRILCKDFNKNMGEIVLEWGKKVVSSSMKIGECEDDEVKVMLVQMNGEIVTIQNNQMNEKYSICIPLQSSVLELMKTIVFFVGIDMDRMVLSMNNNVLMPNQSLQSVGINKESVVLLNMK